MSDLIKAFNLELKKIYERVTMGNCCNNSYNMEYRLSGE